MSKTAKMPVTMRAMMARINRRLGADDQMLRKTRGMRAYSSLGDYYIVNFNRNLIINYRVDPETVAREIGVLMPWEILAC
jgi:hypothetical protein